MKKLTIILILVLSLIGCAFNAKKDSSVPPAMKVLLSLQETIVSAATSADLLCSQNILNQKQCDEVHKVYEDAQPAYDAAADSLIVALRAPDENATAWEKYSYFHKEFLTIYTNMIKLAVRYGLPGFENNGGE